MPLPTGAGVLMSEYQLPSLIWGLQLCKSPHFGRLLALAYWSRSRARCGESGGDSWVTYSWHWPCMVST